MSTNQAVILPAGATSSVFPVTPLMNVCAAPQVLGGTVTLYSGPTQNGPWLAWSVGAYGNAASFRSTSNAYVYAVAATQAAAIIISDMGSALFPQTGALINSCLVTASASTTSEVALYSWRIPPNFLKANFRMEINGAATCTNSANVKTLKVAMNGVGGTTVLSAAATNNANFTFFAALGGIGDGATLKGFGAGASGGVGLSTTAFTTLARDYINNETEFVVTATKATGSETFQLDALTVKLFQ